MRLDLKGGPGHADSPSRRREVTALLTRPACGPVDELTRARLGRVCGEFFGPHPCLQAHLGLLDARGAWYAERAITAWRAVHVDSFFGLVRHVVTTQFDGPRPSPDIETWLAAGRPDDPVLGPAYDLIALARYGHQPDDGILPRTDPATGAVSAVDAAIARWPSGQLSSFVNAYARLETWLHRHAISLPPIDFD